MKFSFIATALFALTASKCSLAVTREECKADYLPATLECIDSFAGKGRPDCDLLPIPDFAMPQNQANELGYWIQELRSTPTSHVFALSENAYSSLILVDIQPAGDEGDSGRKLRGKTRKLQEEEEEEEGLMIDGPVETSDDESASARGLTVSLIDFPPTFQQFDSEGNDAGSHIISAMGDILETLGKTTDDIDTIEMIYTHAHNDHIGLANHTYTYVTETLGFDPSKVPIIATEGVEEFMEHAIELGVFTYRAPLPTETFTGFKEHTVGASTTLTMTTFDGHQFGDKDVIVFMESLGSDNPAIMMVVDIVFPKWVPFFSFALSTDLLLYIDAHDTLLEFPLGDDGYLVGGHLNQVGDRNDIVLNQELTNAILAASKTAIAEVDVFATAGSTGAFTPGDPNFGNSWAAFGKYYDEMERACARIVLEEHGCDFGGLDVTLYSSCRVANSFWRLEV